MLLLLLSSCVPAAKYVSLLGVGINVDWLAFKKVYEAYFFWRALGISVPKFFKEKGFDSVRIRTNLDVVAHPELIKRIKEVVEDSLKAGLVPVLAYSGKDVVRDPTSPKAREHFVRWWTEVAEALKDESHLLAYDLLIEPGKELGRHPAILNSLYATVIKIIRKIDPCRIVIVAPAKASSPFMLKYLNVTNDGYVVAEWHIYAGGPCKRGRITFNSTLIREAVNVVTAWSNETGIPTWEGAWRPLCPDGRGKILGTPEDYRAFVWNICVALASHHIPFAINADSWFFNINTLEWRSDTAPILNEVFRCVKSRGA